MVTSKEPFAPYTRITILLICILFIGVANVSAQDDGAGDESQSNTQIWLDFYPHFFIKEKLQFFGDLGYRTTVGERSWNRVHIRPSVRFFYSDYIQFRGGIGMFLVTSKDADGSFEFSPWQGVHARWPRFTRLYFTHYLRFEERSVWDYEDDDTYSFELRMRYQLTGVVLFCKPCGDNYWSMPFFWEQFFPVASEANEIYKNRTRLGIAAVYKQSRRWQYELGMIWQNGRTAPGEDFIVNDNVIRLKVRRLIQ